MVQPSTKFDLVCGHCGSVFRGSYRQNWNQKNRKSTPYCSSACRLAAMSKIAQEQAKREGKTLRKGLLTQGPCKTCGKMFESRTDKLYCSMDCYVTSKQFREMQAQNCHISDEARAKISAKLRTGSNVPCLECGEPFYRKKSDEKRKKFCCKVCYRAYMAKRFDRWIANPESMALPQCYDEFLDRERLRCVVNGCEWEGVHLTTHMNQAHGLPAQEFKRATGFNLSTGVIARPLAEVFQKRAMVGVAAGIVPPTPPSTSTFATDGSYVRYISLEAREHIKKSRVLAETGPTRVCAECGNTFIQSSQFGRAMYCTTKCRSKVYYRKQAGKRAAKETALRIPVLKEA